MRDDLPADIAVDVLIFDDRDPSQVIAHLALCHRYDDPPGIVAQIEPATVAGLSGDPIFHMQLAGGNVPSLRTVLARSQTIRGFVRGIEFTIPLEPWVSLDPDHTRIAHSIMYTYRYELFTEEQHRWAREEAQQRQKRADSANVGESRLPDDGRPSED